MKIVEYYFALSDALVTDDLGYPDYTKECIPEAVKYLYDKSIYQCTEKEIKNKEYLNTKLLNCIQYATHPNINVANMTIYRIHLGEIYYFLMEEQFRDFTYYEKSDVSIITEYSLFIMESESDNNCRSELSIINRSTRKEKYVAASTLNASTIRNILCMTAMHTADDDHIHIVEREYKKDPEKFGTIAIKCDGKYYYFNEGLFIKFYIQSKFYEVNNMKITSYKITSVSESDFKFETTNLAYDCKELPTVVEGCVEFVTNFNGKYSEFIKDLSDLSLVVINHSDIYKNDLINQYTAQKLELLLRDKIKEKRINVEFNNVSIYDIQRLYGDDLVHSFIREESFRYLFNKYSIEELVPKEVDLSEYVHEPGSTKYVKKQINILPFKIHSTLNNPNDIMVEYMGEDSENYTYYLTGFNTNEKYSEFSKDLYASSLLIEDKLYKLDDIKDQLREKISWKNNQDDSINVYNIEKIFGNADVHYFILEEEFRSLFEKYSADYAKSEIAFSKKKNKKKVAKADSGKEMISLVPTQIIHDIAKIRMYGNAKYHSPDNWKTVSKERYINAMLRHILAYLIDPDGVDEESKLPHLAHAACNMAFILEMDGPNWEKVKNQKTICVEEESDEEEQDNECDSSK